MSNTFDTLLGILSTPDWTSPLWAIIQDVSNGPHCHFYVDRYCGWSVNDIKWLLRRYGIQPWGDMIVEDIIIFTVRKNQSRWTDQVLMRIGLPVLGMSDRG